MNEKQKVYRFFVDGKPCECKEPVISGEQLRAIAGIGAKLRIFVGDHGEGHPDHQVLNSSSVDFAKLGAAKFYTLAPPSMDIF